MYVCLRSSNLSQLSQRPRLITEVSYNFPFPLKYSYTYIFPFVSVLAKGIYHCTCIWVYFKIFTYVCMWKYTLYNFIRIPFEFCFFKIYQFFKQTIPFSSSLIIDSFFITNCCTYHRKFEVSSLFHLSCRGGWFENASAHFIFGRNMYVRTLRTDRATD